MLKGIKHFSQNVRRIWFVAVSKLGKTDLVFVQPGAKINSVYDSVRTYSKQGLLPAIRRISNNFFVFKQDEAPCTPFTTLSPTCISTVSEFIETENRPPNSPDLTPADYSETQSVQRCSRCNATKFQTLISWRKFWSTPGLTEALQDTLNRAIDPLPQRLKMVIKAKGGHVEFCLNASLVYCIFNENWTKLMRHCQVQCNFRGIDDLCKK